MRAYHPNKVGRFVIRLDNAGNQNGNVWYRDVTIGVTLQFPSCSQHVKILLALISVTNEVLQGLEEPIAERWVLGIPPQALRRAGPALRQMEELHAGPASNQVRIQLRKACANCCAALGVPFFAEYPDYRYGPDYRLLWNTSRENSEEQEIARYMTIT